MEELNHLHDRLILYTYDGFTVRYQEHHPFAEGVRLELT